MTPKTKAKLIRKGNRIGKTATSMATDDHLEAPTGYKPRRTIPAKEVDEMINRAVADVKASRTLYDDRNDILRAITAEESCKAHHEQCIHSCNGELIILERQLYKTNTAIARELDLDSLR